MKGFFPTKIDAFKYANDVAAPEEEASTITKHAITDGDQLYQSRQSGLLVSLQRIAAIWTSSMDDNLSTDLGISGLEAAAMNRVAVAVDDHLRHILERCIHSV